ncbi:MAG: CDP-glucose 4,6-dehydratase [Chlamydiota bacterium]
MFLDIYREKKVLLTGHTGFKGAWLATWLAQIGSEVVGFSLNPITQPNLFEINGLSNIVKHYIGDIRDAQRLAKVVQQESPDIIIHFAAQSLVLESYQNPLETFEVNALGTVNVLNAAVQSSNIAAVLVITTDKVYENHEWCWGYKENDHLGGHDPYSASKAMAEIAAASYRRSFGASSGLCIATARAGNVIGGGDFAENRLLPDSMKSLMSKQKIELRNPRSVRPWMHVLDPLCGYLWLGSKMLSEGESFAQAWNFAPKDHIGITCQQVVERVIDRWEEGDWIDVSEEAGPKEMNCLRLNGDKAAHELGWTPLYDWKDAVDATVDWFKLYHTGSNMFNFTAEQIHTYMKNFIY